MRPTTARTGAWRCDVPSSVRPTPASVSTCSERILLGPEPNRPSAGSSAVGMVICTSRGYDADQLAWGQRRPDERSVPRERPDRHDRDVPVSYTHLRAHETDSYLVCR